MVTISTCGIVMGKPITKKRENNEYYVFYLVVSDVWSKEESKEEAFVCVSTNPKVQDYDKGTALYVSGFLDIREVTNKEGNKHIRHRILVKDCQVFK